MPIEIRDVDVHDDVLMRTYYDVAHEATTHGREFPTMPSAGEVLAKLRAASPERQLDSWAAFDGGEIVGYGGLYLPLLSNVSMAFFEAAVLPGRRRQGIGSALVEHTVERARKAGRTMLLGGAWCPPDAGEDHPFRRFAAKHGFEPVSTEIRRLQQLPVDEQLIQGWVDEAAPHHRGYRIETYVDEVPRHLLPSYVAAMNRLAADAPFGEIDFEPEAATVETYLERRSRDAKVGRRVHKTLAITSGADGDEVVAGYTNLACPPPGHDLPYAHQGGTLVLAEHRGHRLGIALKAANLHRFQADHPERTLVSTTNSEVNGPMVAINETMGFRPVEVYAEFGRKL